MSDAQVCATWPVRTIERSLARLALASGVERGSLRVDIRRALARLPTGAIDEATWSRWRAAIGVDADGATLHLDRARALPAPGPGQGYLLSVVDGEGCVIDAAVHPLGERQSPWASVWSAGVHQSVDGAARDAYAQAAGCLAFPMIEPLVGWHRIELSLPEGCELSDRSCTAAIALLLLSCWLRQRLDPSVAVTGDLAPDGSLVLPAEARRAVRAKACAVRTERAAIRRLLVPPGFSERVDGLQIEPVSNLRGLAAAAGLDLMAAGPAPLELHRWVEAVGQCDALALTRAATVDALRGRLERLDEAYRRLFRPVGVVGELASVVTERVRQLTRLCLYQTHAGELDAALAAHTELDGLLRERAADIPFHLVAAARNVEASLLIDLHRFATARELIAEAASAAARAGDRLEGARIESTRGRIAAHAGQPELALQCFDEALRGFAAIAPWESNIARTYRIDALARLGRAGDAWAALDEARAASSPAHAVPDGWRNDNDVYLLYQAMKVALVTDEPARGRDPMARALELAGRGAWPGLGIRARAVELAGRLGDDEEAARQLRELEAVAAGAPRALATTELGRAAAATLLAALEDERRLDETALERLQAWLAFLAGGEPSRLGSARDDVTTALGASSLPALATSLRALLWHGVY